jgi:hypothetical protein
MTDRYVPVPSSEECMLILKEAGIRPGDDEYDYLTRTTSEDGVDIDYATFALKMIVMEARRSEKPTNT